MSLQSVATLVVHRSYLRDNFNLAFYSSKMSAYNLSRSNRGVNKMLDPSYLESTETFERAIKDVHWLVRFESDGRSMNIPASYSGIDADVYSRFKAKVSIISLSKLLPSRSLRFETLPSCVFQKGDLFRIKLVSRKTSWEFGEVKAIGFNGYIEALLHRISAGEFDTSFANDPKLISSPPSSATSSRPETQVSKDTVLTHQDVIAAVTHTSDFPVITEQEVNEALTSNQEDLIENIENFNPNVVSFF